jgi:hypothetical protein
METKLGWMWIGKLPDDPVFGPIGRMYRFGGDVRVRFDFKSGAE